MSATRLTNHDSRLTGVKPPLTTHHSPLTDGCWYVVQTKPRQEFRAEAHLRNQGFRCVLPTLQAERIRRGKRVFANEPLFARYLFIELSALDAKWSVLRSTRGVSRLVEFGGVPAKLPAVWIENFQCQAMAPRRLFEPGQRVVVTQGPFSGLEGIYEMPDGESRAIVLMELLSRPCKAAFPVAALRRAG